MANPLRWIAIAWAPYSRRSEMFARLLGGPLHRVHYLRFQSPLHAPFKYVLQAIRTLQILFAERPQAVHVQNPPFVCGLVISLYCRLRHARFVFDHHSAAFGRTWRWALPVQKFLARRAVTNIVTNQYWADIVRSWGAHAVILGDPFLPLPPARPFEVKDGFNLVFISTFAADEPLDAVLAAVRDLPRVHVYITGNASRQPPEFFRSLPPNVTCTGFLPDAQYVGLLHAADAVMALTTRDHTLQLGGCEAVSAGKPLITSDWPFLQEFFSRGAIHVDNSPEGIRAGILAMQQNHTQLQADVRAFKEAAQNRWHDEFARLNRLVEQSLSA